jgi:hypothetical protein
MWIVDSLKPLDDQVDWKLHANLAFKDAVTANERPPPWVAACLSSPPFVLRKKMECKEEKYEEEEDWLLHFPKPGN